MKKILVILLIMVLALGLCSCYEEAVEVERTAIDCRYTAARSEVVTSYKHKYSWWQEKFVLVPDVHTKSYPEKYEILYLISYDNGDTRELWLEVSQSEYLAFKGGDTNE